MSALLVDTGAIVALLDRSDALHEWAITTFKSLQPPLLTCEAVMAEAWHLLGAAPPSRQALSRLYRDGIIQVSFDFAANASAVWRLLQKYHDVPMDFANGCLVRMAEIHPRSRVWTATRTFTSIGARAAKHFP